MDTNEVKSLIDAYHAAGKSREETIAIISALPINGETSQAFEYCDLKYKAGLGKFNLTDYGNAERLVAKHGKDIRYSPERKMWLSWNGKYWEWDTGDIGIKRLAKQIAREIYHEAAEEIDDNQRKEVAKHAKVSESQARVEAMIASAQSELGIAIKVSELDANHYLLNCNNGTVNLKTGTLQPHDRADYITRMLSIDYSQDAKSNTFQAFLDRIFNGNKELVTYVQTALGYSITGSQSEIAFFFCHGSGWNGKGTLLGAVRDVLGDYAHEVEPAAFMVQKGKGGGPDEATASLYGKRFVVSTELTDGQRLSVGLVKRMTGGEQIRCEHKYERGFMFRPSHKLWLCGNHEPEIRDSTISIWRRIKKIPFTQEIPEEERIKDLREILVKDDGPAILAWLVQGCLNWQNEGGLNDPSVVKEAVSDYKARQDILHEFITERCDLVSTGRVTLSLLYEAYANWCKDNNQDSIGSRTFNNRMREKGLTSAPGTDNKTTWHGIKLKELSQLI